MFRKIFIIFLPWVALCASYNILLVFPFPFKSHCILGDVFASILLSAGHKVTHITSTTIVNPRANPQQIVVKPYNYKAANLTELTVDNRSYQYIFEQALNVTFCAIRDEKVQRLMKDVDQSFDLVVADWMFNDLYSGHLQLSVHMVFPSQSDYDVLRLMNAVSNPWMISSNYVLHLNFLGRTRELLKTLWSSARKYLYSDLTESKAYEELFREAVTKRGRSLPLYENIRYNASFFFSNSHFAIRDRLVTPYNHKTIGGYHITDAPEPINQEILNIIKSSNGIIPFSLGSFLKAEDLPNFVKTELLEKFSKLNQTILRKIDEQFDDLPTNVKTLAWLPIQSVLAHPKCVLFISHGGMLSMTESVHYGVPIIGVPIYGDQTVNVKTVVNRGVAKMVLISIDLADNLIEAINDMLSDPGYKEKMRALSSLYHDRALPPRAELLHWVEHVATIRGNMLRPAVQLTPWYYACCLDLTAALLLLFYCCLLFVVNKLRAVIRANVTCDIIDVMTKKRK